MTDCHGHHWWMFTVGWPTDPGEGLASPIVCRVCQRCRTPQTAHLRWPRKKVEGQQGKLLREEGA